MHKELPKPHGIFAAGGAFVPTQEKKNLGSYGIEKDL